MKQETADTIKSILRDYYDYSPKNDPWGSSMQAFFDVAGEMFNRSLSIPSAWEYSPGMGTPTIEDEYIREKMEGLTDEELAKFGAVLHRLTDKLKKQGRSY